MYYARSVNIYKTPELAKQTKASVAIRRCDASAHGGFRIHQAHSLHSTLFVHRTPLIKDDE